MDNQRVRKLSGLKPLEESVEQLNEAKLIFGDFQTKFTTQVLKAVAKGLDKRFETNIKVHKRDNRSMSTMEFKGYTKSDTEFTGSLLLIMDAPAGSGINIVELELTGVNGSTRKEIMSFRMNDVVDIKKIITHMHSETEYLF